MREIKFRAYHYDTNFMQGNETIFINNGKLITGRLDIDKDSHINNIYPDSLQYEEGNYEIMQYTGLRDKYKTEIYEGDILRDRWGNFHYVKYGKGMWECPLIRKVSHHWPALYLHCDYMRWEVIGNIYENPELIKEG